MNRPTITQTKSTGRRKIAVALASIFTIGSITQIAAACDYCDQGDGGIVCPAKCDTGCGGCGGIGVGTSGGPIFKTLDKLAGGLEKVLRLKKCVPCDTGCCDEACDAMMMDELMYPTAPATTDQYYEPPMVPAVPPESYSPAPPAHHPYVEPVLPQTLPQEPVPHNGNEGGLFETLNNPFNDDEVRNSSRRMVRPSSYQHGSAFAQPTRSSLRYRNASSSQTNAHRQPVSSPVHRTPTTNRSSLKRAAARGPVATQPVSTRTTHHDNARQHQASNQVQLNRAPLPTNSASRQLSPRSSSDNYYRR